MSHDSRTAPRICPLCEATCGLTLTIEGTTVTGARGDHDDVFSQGFICPKGASFGGLDADPDRLRTPLVRTDGVLREATWSEAFDAVAAKIPALTREHGEQAVGVYLGNPNVHTMAGGLYPPLLLSALGTRNVFTASTLDQMPKHVSSGLLFGDAQAIPVPDLDRTAHLLLIGANPLESNGSLCTAPDFPGRLRALRRRGGTLTVVDPRRTRTARLADRHAAIRPGTDALLLAALTQVLVEEKLTDPGALGEHLEGLDELTEAIADFTPEAVAAACDLDAETIRAIARELAAAPAAAVYGRIGSCTVEHGTLASWLVDVLNILTGNLDRPGGALFPLSATARAPRAAAPGKGFALGRWTSRVSGHPEAKGELPVSALAEEIETPGEGRIRALIVVAGNPVLSAPDGDRLDRALADGLDFMVSVDPYLNETSRHADVVLPPPPPSQGAHFDFALNSLAVRNQVRYSRPAVPLEEGRMDESEILARLVLAVGGMHGAPPEAVDDRAIGAALAKAGAPASLAGELTGRTGAERRLDLMLRLGPYGLTLEQLLAHPHGIDLGPLKPRLPEVLRTRSGRIELLPAPIAADLPRLRASLGARPAGLVLVGRRHLRSNNSWMHNVPALRGGSNVCTLQIHPDDAARIGLADGDTARITAAGGEVEAFAEITDSVRTGVVSLPHGWGHSRPGTRMSVAGDDPGVNVNQLLDGTLLDPLSGTAVLNAVPVTVTPSR
ncbi:anaerobic selenocysteine-containing dehydrogenase [Streptomyces avidinii]|uniref:molybdopterin oxidoreductase family protein n=1 Tax=Streptomyces TaxID=1883 RepID=UPI000BCD1704|nr:MULTISPECIES: molybdopterin oxidoreductase family protein [unclassified Streptomyces]MDF9873308.1 anaerobic selenocysteine-containing dehydrogenase [Streptomyces pratensis]RAS28053.1 anaerobic selenocysteine-containing dehydrogenase [Streptomyces avidinii]SNX79346.1 Anaerobic selenocysteine-containing dehydrogenase [Streptomyces microflavus]MCY1650708.1 molybdopterin oxidoreductase family protein [Streptomyces sp. SL203]MCY1682150.1 molybdopterin oxidoreductase family protein [Streptomyces 